jgi:hypothetical protein
MDRISREQMVAEFGEPGVQNPAIVDLIEPDRESDRVVLAMIERREWGGDPQQFQQIAEKINRYLGYVLDGHFGEQYPQYVGKRVVIRLDCARPPHGDAVRFVNAARDAIHGEGLDFVVRAIADDRR